MNNLEPLTLITFNALFSWDFYQPEIGAHIYAVDFDGDYSYAPFLLPVIPTKEDISTIRVIVVDSTLFLREVETIPELYDEPSFMYIADEKRVLFTLPNYDPPSVHDIQPGLLFTASDKPAIYEGDYYPDTLATDIPVSKTIDHFFEQKIQFPSFTAKMQNVDGQYDGFADLDIYKLPVIVYKAYGKKQLRKDGHTFYWLIDTAVPVLSAYLEKFSVGTQSLTLSAADYRKILSNPIANHFYAIADYPNIEDSLIGKPIPVRYGHYDNKPGDVLNGETSDADGYFLIKLADTEDWHSVKSIDSAALEDGTAVTISNKDLDEATCQIPLTVSGESISPGDVLFTFEGYKDDAGALIENALDIIVDILSIRANIPYTANRYNLEQWETTRDIAYPCFMEARTEQIIDKVADLVNSNRVIFRVDDQFRFTAYKPDPDHVSELRIFKEEITNYKSLKGKYDPAELISDLNVIFGSDERSEPVTVNSEYVNTTYRESRSREFNTLLAYRADAVLFGNEAADAYKDILPPFNIEIRKKIDIPNEGDNILIQLDRISGVWFGWILVRIESLQISTSSDTISMKVRFLEQVDYIEELLIQAYDGVVYQHDDDGIIPAAYPFTNFGYGWSDKFYGFSGVPYGFILW